MKYIYRHLFIYNSNIILAWNLNNMRDENGKVMSTINMVHQKHLVLSYVEIKYYLVIVFIRCTYQNKYKPLELISTEINNGLNKSFYFILYKILQTI